MSSTWLVARATEPPDDGGGWLDWLDPGEWIQKAGAGILEQIAEGVGDAAASLLLGIWGVIADSTMPQVDAVFLKEWFGRVFAISLPLTVGFMVLQVILSVLRNRGSAGLGRAVWGGAAAVLGTFAAVPVVALMVSAVDALAMDLAAITSGDIETLIGQVTSLLLGDSTADGAHLIGGGLVGTVGAIILGFLTVVGAVAVWVALLIRAMLLYVVVVIAPICFAGLAWEPTRGWFRRWLTMIVALVFTKLGVVLVFSLGVSAVGTAGLGNSSWEQLGQLFAGLVMLLMASLVPIACFKFFSFLGDESVQALHAGAAGGAARGADAVRGMANRPMDALRRQASSSSGGGGSSSGGSSGSLTAGTPQPSNGAQSAGASPGAPPTAGGGSPATAGAGATGSSPAGSGAGGVGAAAGGALVGAGIAAGSRTVEAGRSGAAHADAHRDQADSGDGGTAPQRRSPSKSSGNGNHSPESSAQPTPRSSSSGGNGAGPAPNSPSSSSRSASRSRPSGGSGAGTAPSAPPTGKP